jgi:ADP-glucose pyrophosphorylase
MRKLWCTFVLPVAFSGGLMLAQDQQPQQQEPSARQQSQADQQITGKIVKSNDGKYVLVDSSSTMYQLDDQDAAKKHEGRKVIVTGSLDASGSMIHVTSIKPAR